MRSRSSVVIGAYALMALLVIPVFPHFVSPNELTRWALAAALVEEQSLEVTRVVRMLGPRFEDLADVDGRLYSNKAPGAALVGVPGYLVARSLAGPPLPDTLRLFLTAMRLFAATLPTLLTAMLFVRIGRQFGVDERRIALMVWVLLFATPLFAYGLLFFSHALVAATLAGAWAFLFVLPASPRHDLVAGALIGLSVFSEYTAAIPAAVLMLALIAQRRWATVLRTSAAGLPFAVLLAAYHYLAFGSVARTPYFYEKLLAYRDVARSGFFGLHAPSPRTLFRLLVDPARGLLTFSPVLILTVPALAAARTRLPRAAWWTLMLVAASVILLYSGYPNWHGGWNVGPRYIVGAIPFLVLPLLFRTGGPGESLLAGASALAVFLTSIVFPFPPNDFPLPWGSLAMPLLADGLIAPNALHLVAQPLAIAVPFVLLLAASATVFRPRQAVFATAGAVLALLVGTQWQLVGDASRVELQRRYIAEVYFEQPGSLGAAPPGLLRRRALEVTLPPPSWPF